MFDDFTGGEILEENATALVPLRCLRCHANLPERQNVKSSFTIIVNPS